MIMQSARPSARSKEALMHMLCIGSAFSNIFKERKFYVSISYLCRKEA